MSNSRLIIIEDSKVLLCSYIELLHINLSSFQVTNHICLYYNSYSLNEFICLLISIFSINGVGSLLLRHSEDSSKNVRINEENFIIFNLPKRMRYEYHGESHLSPKQTNVPSK